MSFYTLKCLRDPYEIAPRKGSSSSSSSQSSEQTDKRIAASDQAVVVQLEQSSVLDVDLIDPGAMDLADGALSLIEKAFEKAMNVAESSQSHSKAMLDVVLQHSKTEEAQGVDNFMRNGVIVAGIAAAAFVLPKVLKKR